jgi:hypothetical protein
VLIARVNQIPAMRRAEHQRLLTRQTSDEAARRFLAALTTSADSGDLDQVRIVVCKFHSHRC